MNIAQFMSAARLWDEDVVIGQARDWCESEEGRWFLNLKKSQIGALERALGAAHGRDAFLTKLEQFTSDAAKRGKGRTLWTNENALRLKAAFERGLAAGGVAPAAVQEAYRRCERAAEKAQQSTDVVKGAHDEAILRAYMAALVTIRSARERKAAG